MASTRLANALTLTRDRLTACTSVLRKVWANPDNKRRVFLVALVLLTLWVCFGCASLSGNDWDAYPTHTPLPAYIVRVDNVQAKCGTYPRFTTLACAVRDYKTGVCTIYVDRDPTPQILSHELMHCAGADHEQPGIPR